MSTNIDGLLPPGFGTQLSSQEADEDEDEDSGSSSVNPGRGPRAEQERIEDSGSAVVDDSEGGGEGNTTSFARELPGRGPRLEQERIEDTGTAGVLPGNTRQEIIGRGPRAEQERSESGRPVTRVVEEEEDQETVSFPGAPGVVHEAPVEDGTVQLGETEIERGPGMTPDPDQLGGQETPGNEAAREAADAASDAAADAAEYVTDLADNAGDALEDVGGGVADVARLVPALLAGGGLLVVVLVFGYVLSAVSSLS